MHLFTYIYIYIYRYIYLFIKHVTFKMYVFKILCIYIYICIYFIYAYIDMYIYIYIYIYIHIFISIYIFINYIFTEYTMCRIVPYIHVHRRSFRTNVCKTKSRSLPERASQSRTAPPLEIAQQRALPQRRLGDINERYDINDRICAM